MKNIAVLIHSCDKYSLAWPIFVWAFKKYWPDCPYKIYFITNELDAPLGQTIKVGHVQWSKGMEIALGQILEDYVILFGEDFWLNAPTDTFGIERLCSTMVKERVDHIRLYVSEKSQMQTREIYNLELDILGKYEWFRAALNVGIWNRLSLISLLKDEESIWEAEHGMSHRSVGLLFCTVKQMTYINYDISKNMIHKGQFTNDALEYLRKENVELLKWK